MTDILRTILNFQNKGLLYFKDAIMDFITHPAFLIGAAAVFALLVMLWLPWDIHVGDVDEQ